MQQIFIPNIAKHKEWMKKYVPETDKETLKLFDQLDFIPTGTKSGVMSSGGDFITVIPGMFPPGVNLTEMIEGINWSKYLPDKN